MIALGARQSAVRRWASDHLFASRGDTAITIVTLAVGGFALITVVRWTTSTADWSVVYANIRLLLIGRFPAGEEWRVWITTLTLMTLAGMTWGMVRRLSPRSVGVLVGAGLALLLLSSEGIRPQILLGIALFAGGVGLGRARARAPRLHRPLLWAAVLGWIGVWPMAIVLLVGFGGVEVGRWGGFYLNLIIAAIAGMGALPIGILIALGRRSQYQVIRLSCTVMVEVTRGLPLIVVLVLSWIAIQRFLPTLWGINEVGLMTRILVAYTLFTSVYVAVCVGSGLAGLPRGQTEAAAALGLTSVQSTWSVTLPQGMRRAIPALTGEFIDLLMATTLVSVVGMTDILAAARASTEQPAFFGRQKEVLLVVGVAFWLTAYSLSRLGRAAERALAPRTGSEGVIER